MEKIRRRKSIQSEVKRDSLNKRLRKHIDYRRKKFVLEKYIGKIKFFPQEVVKG